MRAKGPLTAGMAAPEARADVCPENVLFAARDLGLGGEKRLFLFYVFPLSLALMLIQGSRRRCVRFLRDKKPP
jgi:hypothetical protein